MNALTIIIMDPLLIVLVHADLRRQRRVRDRLDPFAMEDIDLMERLRFPRHLLIELVTILTPQLYRQTNRNYSLSVAVQLAIALRFYATGTFLRVTGDLNGVSKSTASVLVHAVSNALSQHLWSDRWNSYLNQAANC